ncbi:MAG: hypothetical protein E6415_08645 [Intestinibacter bartlettii]|uniref:hypothetical protein n=1 Tax=Intestinibacter bartlettii TaxID=261299 RepID=UPI00290BF252|nr:hypothetical protein [Intestinibacter bartlettii]MDU6823352.1 hypothetical protein [Intestinibacter bartlettii]
MDKIEILDRDKKTKAVYRLDKEEHLEGYQEEREYNSWLEVIILSIFKVLRFSLYLIINFLKMLIKVIESLFLKNYEPLKPILDKQREIQDKKAKDYIMRNTKPHATTTHNYEFIRSKLFARNYLKIDKLLEKCAKHDAELNDKLYHDIMKRLDIIIVEAERQALSEGYKYAKQTRYKFESQEAFDKYIQDRIMRGEDYREHNRELLEELDEGYNK